MISFTISIQWWFLREAVTEKFLLSMRVHSQSKIIILQINTNRKTMFYIKIWFSNHRYMGDIRVVFDQNDEVAYWKGNPIYLNKYIKQGKYCLVQICEVVWITVFKKIFKNTFTSSFQINQLSTNCNRGRCQSIKSVKESSEKLEYF